MRIWRKIFFTFATVIFAAASINSRAELSFEITNEVAPKTKILFLGFNSVDEKLNRDGREIFFMIDKNLATTNLFETEIDGVTPALVDRRFQEGDETPDEEAEASSSLGGFAQMNGRRAATGEAFAIPESALVEDPQQIGSFSGLAPLNREPVSIEDLPDFKKFRSQGFGAVLIAQLSYDLQGSLEIKLRLWDVLEQRQLFGKFYSSSYNNYKKLGDLISDEVFKALTGEKTGHFNSKIVYVSESGSVKRRSKKISIIDFDGGRQRFLTDGRDLVLTPVFAKNYNEVFFVSYRGNYPQIYQIDVNDLKTSKVGGFYTTNFAAAPHPTDPNIILLCATFDGNSDIYELYIKENRAMRLTRNAAIDTTASYSPDGETIAFISDRAGIEQIYLMDRQGSVMQKISKGDGSYSKPIFSPSGAKIAFTVVRRGQFYIGLMNRDGTGERLLASGYLVEGAKFSPNGRYLIYSKTRGAYGKSSIPRLFTIDIVTGYEREIPLPKGEGATDPDWVNWD